MRTSPIPARFPAAAALLALVALAAPAQDAPPAPEFEAASIKPSQPPQPGMSFMVGCRAPDPGRFTCTNANLQALIMSAFAVPDYRISGPAWMTSDRWDVTAKVPAGATKEQTNLMLRKLLADRFGLVVHRETKEMQVFVLTVGKNGPKLKEYKEGDQVAPLPGAAIPGVAIPFSGTAAVARQAVGDGAGAPPPRPSGRTIRTTMGPGRYGIDAVGVDISALASTLERRLGHHVVNETGLTGLYNFSVTFADDGTVGSSGMMIMGGVRASAPPSLDSASEPLPSVFTAVQDQLGLKLEPKKLPTEIVVVDKADKVPSAN